jgi:protein-tyrosine phosphatase
MIDFHTHVLPTIDDGAKDDSVSADILRQENEQGVQTIVFTPHYYGKREWEYFLEIRQAAMDKIKPLIPLNMEVRLGSEVHITGVNDPSYDTLCALAIEGTKCVLFEFPFLTEWSINLMEKVADFISDTGYTPIIAHAERYREFLLNPALLGEFIRMGCYIQISTSAFLRKSTKKFAFAALKRGLVHCLGTDTHNAENRAPDYAAAKRAVYDKGCGEQWEQAQKLMERILSGETPHVAYIPLRKKWGFYY